MESFTHRNQPDWDELETYLKRSSRSVQSLHPDELLRMEMLYRRVTVQLAQVTSRTRDQRLKLYLNQLSSRAHAVIYLPPRQSIFKGCFAFLLVGFARVIARHKWAHTISLLLLVAGALLGYFASMNDRVAAYALLPASEIRTPGATRDQLLEVLRGGRDDGAGFKGFFASFLFQHNFRVGLLAMASGILLAIPTTFLMLFNGMLLGAFVAVHHMKGINAEVWAWLLPHGVTELGAIVLCGGMGMVLGHAVLHPKGVPRMTRLREVGRDVGLTAIGIGGMLFFAAIIESFLRQSDMTTPQRLWFATGTLVFWALYICRGVNAERRAADQFDQRSESQDVAAS